MLALGGWDASPSQVTPQYSVRLPEQFTGTNLQNWVKRGTVRVKYLVYEHNKSSEPFM